MAERSNGITLSVNDVYKRFGSKGVLQGIHLEIKAGDFVAIVGKSGSGKTTLLRLISGLDTPDKGEIRLADEALKERSNQIRIMFQDSRLLPWRSVLQNVALGLNRDWQASAIEALEHVGLGNRLHEWPNLLSGGERQRVALARALVTRPPLLLLDEPLGALDALTRIEMQRLIERIWLDEGFTAVLITHDVEEAIALSDRVVLLEHGKIALDLGIDLPRPRSRGSAQFAALKEQVLSRVLAETSIESSAV